MKDNLLTTTTADQGACVSVMGGTYRLVITGQQTNGAYAVIDMLIPPGGGPGPHAHPDFHESFHVLEGEVEVKTEVGTYQARKGDFLNIPTGGMVHGFKNKSDQLARLWCVVVPAGLENFFQEVGTPVAAGTFLPPPSLGPDDIKRLAAIAQKYGQQVFPPNYLG
ncbi:cupin domain-containing protein [Spirosoma endophyticum]|uniref:Cupin domain-containing protein n=1 Tax=Spirosoma endophyticum TaxID=662367 RepID=A0A1I2DUV8_9BACT|nr:cupin domain-containing protein [Spirosoma endophyticum]SFE84375.1 Cupin domain-containing protein [Spirosoma endophyticum]